MSRNDEKRTDMAANMRDVLLVGGPGNGQTVQVPESAEYYQMVTVEELAPTKMNLLKAELSIPERRQVPVRHTYRIGLYQPRNIWFGADTSIPHDDVHQAVVEAIRERDRKRDVEMWNKLCAAADAFGVAIGKADVNASEKPVNPDAEGRHHITIKTTKPDKWRFFDTETGETWRWDVESNSFKNVVYT
jgi:hypothetical protein